MLRQTTRLSCCCCHSGRELFAPRRRACGELQHHSPGDKFQLGVRRLQIAWTRTRGSLGANQQASVCLDGAMTMCHQHGDGRGLPSLPPRGRSASPMAERLPFSVGATSELISRPREASSVSAQRTCRRALLLLLLRRSTFSAACCLYAAPLIRQRRPVRPQTNSRRLGTEVPQ